MTTAGRSQWRHQVGGGGFFAGNEPRWCIGLGDAEIVESLEVFREEIRDTCQIYMADLVESLQRLKVDPAGERAVDAESRVMQPLAQLETTVSNLQGLDFEEDLHAAPRRLQEEVKRITSVSDSLVEWMESVS